MIGARLAIVAVLLAIPATATGVWIKSAKTRLAESQAAPAEGAPVASQSDVGYCSPSSRRSCGAC